MSKTQKVYEFNTEKFNSKFLSILDDAAKTGGDWQKTWQVSFDEQYKVSELDLESKDNKPSRYRGVNQMLMSIVSDMMGYQSKFYGSYNTWRKLGYAPSGPSPVGIITPKMKEADNGKLIIYRWVTIPAWNGSDVKPVHPKIPKWNDSDYIVLNNEPKVNEVNMNKDCELLINKFMKRQGIDIKHQGSSAYYVPSTDSIVIPEQWRFEGIGNESNATQEYLSTIFHEAGHATGHETRCNRDLKSFSQDPDSYAREELVAEMCSIMVCTELGVIVKPQPNHLRYISSWNKKIKEDSQYLIKCIAQASSAAQWILENKKPNKLVN